MNKKHKRNENNNNNDEINSIQNNKEIIEYTFIFSCIKDDYFLMIKNLIRFNFQFENISINGLSDLIIQMKEDIGITIKIENDIEDKIFAIFTLIPFKYYNKNPVINQLLNLIIKKFEYSNVFKENKNLFNNIIKFKNLSLLINDRILNFPEQLIPNCYKLLLKEYNECIQDESSKNKFNIDYIILISKFIKNKINNNIINKKIKLNENNNNCIINSEILFYKYETSFFIQESEINFDYKIPYIENGYDIENENEPQYINISFISKEKFIYIINNYLL